MHPSRRVADTMTALWFSNLSLLAAGAVAFALSLSAPGLALAATALAAASGLVQRPARVRLAGEVPAGEARLQARIARLGLALYGSAVLVAVWRLVAPA